MTLSASAWGPSLEWDMAQADCLDGVCCCKLLSALRRMLIYMFLLSAWLAYLAPVFACLLVQCEGTSAFQNSRAMPVALVVLDCLGCRRASVVWLPAGSHGSAAEPVERLQQYHLLQQLSGSHVVSLQMPIWLITGGRCCVGATVACLGQDHLCCACRGHLDGLLLTRLLIQTFMLHLRSHEFSFM